MTPARAAMDAPGLLRIEVAFGSAPREVDRTALLLPAGTTAGDAVHRSGVLQRHPALAAQPLAIGIWGQACAADAPLRDGDRVELYRPLRVDPKDARRTRSRQQAAAGAVAKR